MHMFSSTALSMTNWVVRYPLYYSSFLHVMNHDNKTKSSLNHRQKKKTFWRFLRLFLFVFWLSASQQLIYFSMLWTRIFIDNKSCTSMHIYIYIYIYIYYYFVTAPNKGSTARKFENIFLRENFLVRLLLLRLKYNRIF